MREQVAFVVGVVSKNASKKAVRERRGTDVPACPSLMLAARQATRRAGDVGDDGLGVGVDHSARCAGAPLARRRVEIKRPLRGRRAGTVAEVCPHLQRLIAA